MKDGPKAGNSAEELIAQCLARAEAHRQRAATYAAQLREQGGGAPAELRARLSAHQAEEVELRFIADWLASGEEYLLEPPQGEDAPR